MPKTVASLGGKFAYPNLSHETPDTQNTIYEFDDFILDWEHAMSIDNGPYGRDHGISFIGNNGTLILDRGGWEVIEEKRAKNKSIVSLSSSILPNCVSSPVPAPIHTLPSTSRRCATKPESAND